MEFFCDHDFHLIRRGNELLAKEFVNFHYHSKHKIVIQNFHTLLLFHLITKICHLFLLKAPLLILLTLYNPRSFLVPTMFQLLLEKLLPSLF